MCFSEFAGYGHRLSMSTGAHGVQIFGGCYLPQSPHERRPLSSVERDRYIFQYSPAGIKDWVQRCTAELNRTPKREDVVQSILQMKLPEADKYTQIGLYILPRSARLSNQEVAACYELDTHVPLPSSVDTDFRRPPEPRSVDHMGADLQKIWEVHMARQERSKEEFPELPRSVLPLSLIHI